MINPTLAQSAAGSAPTPPRHNGYAVTRRILAVAMTLTASLGIATVAVAADVGSQAASAAVSARPQAARLETGAAAELTAVAAIPHTTSAWAVGEKCGPPDTCPLAGPALILRLSGSGWSPVRAPSPAGGVTLTGVAASSSSNAWAVGSYGEQQNLFLHWNGRSWKQVSGPSEEGSLDGVAVTSPTNAWAVGSYDGQGRTLVLHWNGRKWAQVASPDPSSGVNVLYAVTAVSQTDVWAVGAALMPNATYEPLILHWKGHGWKTVPGPRVDTYTTELSGVAAVAGSDLWAVGRYDNAHDSSNPLIFRGNGTTWTRISAPGASTSLEALYSVAGTSPAAAWAVGIGPCVGGSIYCPSHTLILRWRNGTWTAIRSPSVDDQQDQNVLTGVAAISAKDAWAVGSYFPAASGQPVHALLLRWNGTSWTEH
jgi:hypothetical protein